MHFVRSILILTGSPEYHIRIPKAKQITNKTENAFNLYLYCWLMCDFIVKM